jgi:N-methylhydantoinase A
MPVPEAAYGIFELAVATMTRAVKAVSTYRGRDPRDFALFAFGGNGPVVGAAIATELDIKHVVVPQSPGVFSALGLLLSDSEYDFAKTVTVHGQRLVASELAEAYAALEREARDVLVAEGVRAETVKLTRFADMRYLGQAYELTVPASESLDVEEMIRSFAQVVSIRIVARDGYERTSLTGLRTEAAGRSNGGGPSERDVFFGARGLLRTPVIGRGALEAQALDGPLIIEEYDATCVVPPGWTASLDQLRNINLEALQR